jgi:hypothetical protein
MDLLKDIKQKRASQKQKKPFKGNIFNQISSIVKWYGLKENFLDELDKVDNDIFEENLKHSRVRLREPIENHLFSLVTKDEYTLTMLIIDKIDNPYLKFANSPEDLVWCGPLYCLNPSMDSEKLRRYHFETLYSHERAKAKNRK